MFKTQKSELPIEVPADQLSESAMAGVIENFILREGTDYGAVEASYDTKAAQILRQIKRGEIRLIFDQESETVSLLREADFQRLLAAHSSRE